MTRTYLFIMLFGLGHLLITPEGKQTFVQELRNAGYWTGLAGKYHMGDLVRDDFDVLLILSNPDFDG